MLYMALEGNRPSRIFVDRPSNSSVALIWNGREYAYLVRESAEAGLEVAQVVGQSILPALDEARLDFISLFIFGVSPDVVQSWFPKRLPMSFGVNSFTFERSRYEMLQQRTRPLPPSYKKVKLDKHTLEQPAYQGIREDIIYCWDSLDRFEAFGLGYAIQNLQGEVVCACYAIGYGVRAFHIDIWTHHDHRRKGLAQHAALAFLEESLQKDQTIYWINDAPNIASVCPEKSSSAHW